MTDPTPTDTPTPAGPASPAPEAKNGEKLFTQAEFEERFKERLARVKGGEEADRRFAELEKTAQDTKALLEAAEKRATEAEQRAVQSAVTGLLTDFHPGADKFLNLEGVTSENVAEKVGPQLEALKTSHPFLVKAAEGTPGTTGPAIVPTPGSGSTEGNAPLLSAAELDRITPEQMAADPELFKRVQDARKALEDQA